MIVDGIISEIFIIAQKGSANRPDLKGDPEFDKKALGLLTQGQAKEVSVSNKILSLQKRQRSLMEKITSYFDLHRLAIDGQLPDLPRKFKYASDAIHFMSVIQSYIKQTMDVIGALQADISTANYILLQMQEMVNYDLVALSTLLQDVCNWGLPILPSLPNLFGDTIWRFNGWQFFPLGSFLTYPNFNYYFTFGQCKPLQLNPYAFDDYPTTIKVAGSGVAGSGYTLGTTAFNPPLNGTTLTGTPTDPGTIQKMQGVVDTPVFSASPKMVGSLPDPTTIVSNYQLPPPIYKNNVISTVPSLSSIVSDTTTPVQEAKAFQMNVTLDGIVASGYNPNLTACWLFYMDACHTGRGGTWLPNFAATWKTSIQPSLDYLAGTSVPWNNVLGGSGVQNAPIAIPLIASLKSDVSNNLHWKLSYLEASLLGYSRTKNFDSGADTSFLSTFIGDAVDFNSVKFDTAVIEPLILGVGEADYPVSVTIPSTLKSAILNFVPIAAQNIANNPSWRTTRPQYMYTYDEFANPIPVDRFSQFWREVVANLKTLLTGDPFVVSYIFGYPQSLDGALDPLCSDTSPYTIVNTDASTRNRTWVPGTPLLPIPPVPSLSITSDFVPDSKTSGWMDQSTFDTATFMARPDVQAQSIPVQIAMLRTNQSYADLMAQSAAIQSDIRTLIASAQDSIRKFTNQGFQVESTQTTEILSSGTPVPFDVVDFDNTNFVQSASSFIVPIAGTYMLAGVVRWGTGPACVRTISVTMNDSVVIETQSTDAVTEGPVDQPFAFIQVFSAGDTFKIMASSNAGENLSLASGSQLYCLLPPGSSPTVYTEDQSEENDSSSAGTTVLTAGEDLAVGVAITIDSDGKAVAIDPATTTVGATPYISGITLQAASNNTSCQMGTTFGGVYEIPGASFTVGGIIYASSSGSLTQDYSNLMSTVRWVCVVGRAVTSSSILFQPHIPSNTVKQF